MITVPTVLILGAGASADYHIPAGSNFRNQICALASDSHFIQEVEAHGVPQVGEFLKRFCRSAYRSPDRWLEDFPDYIPAGKYCIARVLKAHEDEQYLIPPSAPSMSWYEYLLGQLEPGSDSYFDKNLTILTFNYDRSLDHYMWMVIESRFSHDHRVMDHIWAAHPEIIHLHGQLGSYDRFGETVTPYRPLITVTDLEHAQKDIRIITEMDPDDQIFDAAEAALNNAKRIYFLGFGFDNLNVRRLRVFPKQCSDDEFIGGTRMGISDLDWREILDKFLAKGGGAWSFENSSIYNFISRPDVLI